MYVRSHRQVAKLPRFSQGEVYDAGWVDVKYISHKVSLKSFHKSQLSHKVVNVCFTITNTKNTLTCLCGNRLLQNDFKSTIGETKMVGSGLEVPWHEAGPSYHDDGKVGSDQ